MKNENRPYSIEVHRFRSAAWAASTAASASPKCRFKVEIGTNILENSNCEKYANGWNELPTADEFDEKHLQQCLLIQEKARDLGVMGFSFGVSAKLFNCYLKTLFLGGINADLTDEQMRKRDAIHPPIDRVLLEGLAKKKIGDVNWRKFANDAWSTYDEDKYKKVIGAIRSCFPNTPLWQVEYYWKGHQ